MEIIRDDKEIKLIFETNISIKEYETQTKGTQLQYIATLPAHIGQMFQLPELKKQEEWGGDGLTIYHYENKLYLIPNYNTWYGDRDPVICDATIGGGTFTHPYKLKNGVYKITLTKRMFGPMINPEKKNIIRYIIHTGQQDINYRPGLVEVQILQQDKEE